MLKYIFIIILLLLHGCTNDSESSEHKITSYRVVDSYQNSSDEVWPVSINASIVDGEFRVFWETTASSLYYMSLVLSHDHLTSQMTVFDQYCGSSNSDCSNFGDLVCHFSMDLIVSCGDFGPNFPFNKGADLSGILTQLPEEFYLSLVVCNKSIEQCNTRTIQIVLQ